MQSPLDAGTIVVTELSDALGHVGQVLPRYLILGKVALMVVEPGLGSTTEVHHNFDETGACLGIIEGHERINDVRGQDRQQIFEIICDLFFIRIRGFFFFTRGPSGQVLPTPCSLLNDTGRHGMDGTRER